MSRIQNLLASILSATYGRDVRSAIHDSIEQCYTDVTSSATAADSAATAAVTATTSCMQATADCITATNNAQNVVETVQNDFSLLGLSVVDGKICVEVERNE